MNAETERNTSEAILRGFFLKCPACGKGRILHKYLKVKDSCEHCGLELKHASVDDGPAYFTLMIVVAIVFPFFAVIYSQFDPEPLFVALFLMTISTVLALFFLPRVKGLFVGLQWSKRLYGF